MQARRQMLEEERRRREEAERRLQDEAAHRRRLVEEEVKMREKHFSQVSGTAGGGGGGMRGETLKREAGCKNKIKDCQRKAGERRGGRVKWKQKETRRAGAKKKNKIFMLFLISLKSG